MPLDMYVCSTVEMILAYLHPYAMNVLCDYHYSLNQIQQKTLDYLQVFSMLFERVISLKILHESIISKSQTYAFAHIVHIKIFAFLNVLYNHNVLCAVCVYSVEHI